MTDIMMILTGLVSTALVWLLIRWCSDQVESNE